MKNKNVKVIDEHNIDRSANIMFAIELEGSEYVVYWIARDEESNNVFVSKVLKNLDGTYNMLNIDDDEKRKEIADIVKTLISNSVTDQNDKLVGVTTTLSNGKVVKFVNVSFNKEQQINVTKTYITTVKKEVTKVSETYYDVVVEEVKVESVSPVVTPSVEPVNNVFPELVAPAVDAAPSVVQPTPTVVEPITAPQPVVESTPNVIQQPVVQTQVIPPVAPAVVQPTQVETQPVSVVAPQVATPVAEPVVESVVTPIAVSEPVSVTPSPVVTQPAPAVVQPTQVETQPVSVVAPQVVTPVAEPATVVESAAQPLVFNASKETNLNAALGEVASSTTIPVSNIEPVREFGVESPTVVQPASAVVQPASVQTVANQPVDNNTGSTVPSSPKSGFANSKFFMVVAIAFFLASCVFLGYEVYNYFQLVK